MSPVAQALGVSPVAPAPRPIAENIAGLAVASLRAEATLAPKPGLVGPRGQGAHADMDLAMLLAAAHALLGTFAACAEAAAWQPVGPALRAHLGLIGRQGERRMLAVTGGVNTHRGAIWALGLLSAAAAVAGDLPGIVGVAATLARIDDPSARPAGQPSHGAAVRRHYGATGAAGEARAGFPHVLGHALPALARARDRGADEATARLDALLAVMAHLEDTCLLHRGGRRGLTAMQQGAAAVLAAGGAGTRRGRRRLAELDRLAARKRLSPGGSADLLSAALFLDSLLSPEGRRP
jgi:triphosphoribosyl-dephospho-CoA synthase